MSKPSRFTPLTLALLAVSLVFGFAACGSEVIVATPTPDAPTATPSPEPTPTPSGIDEKVINACTAACRGEAIPLAAPYDGLGPHPLVLLDQAGLEHEWTDELPRDWWPTSVEDVQVVAVLGAEEEIVIEVCPYTPPPDITRYRYQRSIRFVEAATGATLYSTVLVGNDPRACRQTEPLSLTRLDGDSVSFEQVRDWLEPFVTGEVP